MQARAIGRPTTSSQARLQLTLVALAAWNIAGFLLELTNAAGLVDIGAIDGVLGARAVSGSMLVLGIGYLYAARNPVRYRFLLWLAALEQVVALFSIAFHWALDDIGFGESALPILVAAGFLVLLVANLPRQTDTIGA
jgi:hypothetical protein